jgi:hypothetical protein
MAMDKRPVYLTLPSIRTRYDRRMIGPTQVMIGVLAGCVLILFGIMPGLFQSLVEGVQTSGALLRDPLARRPTIPEPIQQPVWLAGLGAALIIFTLLAHLSQ